MEILNVENLTFKYPGCGASAIKDVSFSLNEGELAVLCGGTGSGKSTLLRLLKREVAPLGEKSGLISYKSIPADEIPAAESASSVGFVMQNPEQQIVTDKVWHELAFGLENLGAPQALIARRVAETASYFGIEHWYDRNVSELSGGQKQLLNLASVMVMGPDILILDEPTAQLDPITASNFITAVRKLNRDFSLTVLIVEHRLEELIPICDRLLVMDGGTLKEDGDPREIISRMGADDPLLLAMPTAARLYSALSARGECPLTVNEGRKFIERTCKKSVGTPQAEEYRHGERVALRFSDVYFKYARELPDSLHGVDLTVYENEIFCILGGNGSGKTTALNVAAGLLRPYSGCVRIFEKKLKEYKNQSLYRECLSLLPQDVQTVFLKNTVREELDDVGAAVPDLPFDISHLYDRHPYDLSGGEQQLVALAKVLATRPKILLMDEPTKGVDAYKKAELATLLKKLKARGITLVIVTHDVEFAAMCADRCALFFRGQAVSCAPASEFFSDNDFYTTAACRMSRGFYEKCITVEDIVQRCMAADIGTEAGHDSDKK